MNTIYNNRISTLRPQAYCLQFISQGDTPDEHLLRIENFCKAGGSWAQLRLKNVDTITYLNTALKCRNICDHYNATMIVNDNVEVAKAAHADGVHLGLKDMDPIEARKILGDNYIIGGTANTIEDCKKRIDQGVDYIGVGPFTYTKTKEKLSPVLGFSGYQNILSELDIETKVPIIAIGGIQPENIQELMDTGIDGIAASGMLIHQTSPKEEITAIKNHIIQALIKRNG